MIWQGSFKGLREDKDPEDVVAETPAMQKSVENKRDPASASRPAARTPASRKSKTLSAASGPSTVMGVTLSKPDKALWPDAGDGKPVTKLDLARYYEEGGEWLLPHLAGRPCSLVRAPDVISGQHTF